MYFLLLIQYQFLNYVGIEAPEKGISASGNSSTRLTNGIVTTKSINAIQKNGVVAPECHIASPKNDIVSWENDIASWENDIVSWENDIASSENDTASPKNHIASWENDIASPKNSIVSSGNGIASCRNHNASPENGIVASMCGKARDITACMPILCLTTLIISHLTYIIWIMEVLIIDCFLQEVHLAMQKMNRS